jgi:hypothetical protein
VEHEKAFLAAVRNVTSQCRHPILIEGDIVAIRWKFMFLLSNGRPVSLEEIAYQRWRDDLIAEETFFFDPAQLLVSVST